MKVYDEYDQFYDELVKKIDFLSDDLKGRKKIVSEQLIRTDEILNRKADNLDSDIKSLLLDNKNFLCSYECEIAKYYSYVDELGKKISCNIKTASNHTDLGERFNGIKYLEAQEEERRRVARELHDSTVQNLAGIIYKIEVCDKLLDTDSTRVHLELQVMIQSIKEVIEEMRNVIYDLRPSILEKCSLSESITKFIGEVNVEAASIHVKLNVVGEEHQLARVVFYTISRVVGEALKNIVKHSNASIVEIELRYGKRKLYITVKDNGQGFDVSKGLSKNQFGLSIMKERVTLLGGKFELVSKINKGTSIWIEVPNAYSEDEKQCL